MRVLALALLLAPAVGATPLAPEATALDTLIVADSPAPARASGDALSNDRDAVLETIRAFYIGDHTGSLEHKVASMHPQGAYRYVNADGEYRESQFRLVEGGADTLYVEELLSIEIYETVALARLRLENQRREEAEYKLMTLHKTSEGWRITSIAWGWGVTH